VFLLHPELHSRVTAYLSEQNAFSAHSVPPNETRILCPLHVVRKCNSFRYQSTEGNKRVAVVSCVYSA
jgi:hypothetical protein